MWCLITILFVGQQDIFKESHMINSRNGSWPKCNFCKVIED